MTQTKRRSVKRQTGFTLIEIMIVIVIIGILATLVVPRLIDRPDQARVIKAKQDISTLQAALQLYKLDNYNYPSQQQGLQALVTKPTQGQVAGNWTGPYIERLPKDPWGGEYRYRVPGEYGAIDIFTLGSDGEEGGVDSAADIGSWSRD
jgi:general secretion pathway protein G